jgi:O-acetyl-ADP-ribose deacetylase (regulator of RNase III)
VAATIKICDGSIFDSQCGVYVNPVNCNGICGAGLAKAFKERFPLAYDDYKSRCNGPVLGPVTPGFVLITHSGVKLPEWIFHFPTKEDWKEPSRLEWIEAGLVDMAYKLQHGPVHSVAIPALGCGLGGLNWDVVRPKIEAYFSGSNFDPHFLVELYPPK